MTYTQTCEMCQRTMSITYNELDTTVCFCPFCGEEVTENEDSIYDAIEPVEVDEGFDVDGF